MKPYFAKYLPVEGELLASKPPKQKMKLFLCSRDIQVGDKVRYGDNPTAPEHEVEAISECSANKCWKVIGEISPEATWAKEGDEFDRDDLYFVEFMKHPIKVKCPTCKKFH